MIPLSYFVLIPAHVQTKVDQIGTPGHEVRVQKVAIGEMTNDRVTFSSKVAMDAMIPLPFYGGFKPFTAYVMVDGKALAQLDLPATAFWLNQEIVLDVSGTMIMNQDNQEATRAFIEKLSSPEGYKDLNINVKMAPPITAFDYTVYTALPLKRDIHLGEMSTAASVLLKSALAAQKSVSSSAITFQPPIKNPGIYN